MTFSAHGTFSITVEKRNIIRVVLQGSFNRDGGVACYDEIKRRILEFNGEGFYIFWDALKFEGATPDCYEVSNEYQKWLSTQKLIKKALLYSSSALESVDEQQLTERKNQNYRYFHDKKEATNWILDIK